MPVEPYGGEMDLEGGWDYENRTVEPGYTPEDQAVENPLRPRTFSEYIGQDKVKENLKIYIEAAKSRKESWTTCCSTARRAWARPRWRALWPTSWGSICASPAARPLRSPGIWRPCSPI